VRLGQEPDRLRGEARLGQVELHQLDALLRRHGAPLVRHDLLGHLELAEGQLQAQAQLRAQRLDDARHRLLLRLRVPVARERLNDCVHGDKVELADEVRLAEVEVDRPFVHRRVRAGALDEPEHCAGRRVDDRERVGVG
jgi:hypothetical protein